MNLQNLNQGMYRCRWAWGRISPPIDVALCCLVLLSLIGPFLNSLFLNLVGQSITYQEAWGETNLGLHLSQTHVFKKHADMDKWSACEEPLGLKQNMLLHKWNLRNQKDPGDLRSSFFYAWLLQWQLPLAQLTDWGFAALGCHLERLREAGLFVLFAVAQKANHKKWKNR